MRASRTRFNPAFGLVLVAVLGPAACLSTEGYNRNGAGGDSGSAGTDGSAGTTGARRDDGCRRNDGCRGDDGCRRARRRHGRSGARRDHRNGRPGRGGGYGCSDGGGPVRCPRDRCCSSDDFETPKPAGQEWLTGDKEANYGTWSVAMNGTKVYQGVGFGQRLHRHGQRQHGLDRHEHRGRRPGDRRQQLPGRTLRPLHQPRLVLHHVHGRGGAGAGSQAPEREHDECGHDEPHRGPGASNQRRSSLPAGYPRRATSPPTSTAP